MEIISRKEAHRLGLNKYFTGKICRHGHAAPRYTASAICTKCNKLYSKGFQFGGGEITKHYRFAGLEKLEFWVHADDRETVEAIVNSMRDERMRAYEATTQQQTLEAAQALTGIGAARAAGGHQ